MEDTASAAPEVEQPVKQVNEAADAVDEPNLANGVHAANEATPEEPAAEAQDEASQQRALEVTEAPREPEADSDEPAEEQNDGARDPEAEGVDPKPDEQLEPEAESAAPAAPVREELPIWRKRCVIGFQCCQLSLLTASWAHAKAPQL